MKYLDGLRKFFVPEIIYGPGARFLVANYVSNLGVRKVMVLSEPGVIKAGWTNDVIHKLKKAEIDVVLYDHFSPNPRDFQVMEGARVYLDEGCEAIVAVGGGSTMDYAKGVGIVVVNSGHILDYEGIDKIKRPTPPLICIPTTAGSAADVSQFAIITDTKREVKIAIVSKAVVPDLSLIDPETTLTLDARFTAITGMDTLTHAIEAYVSRAHSPLTDVHALEAIRLVSKYLKDTIKDLKNIKLRGKMMQACTQAGFAFSNAILGAVHAMTHALGGFMDLPYGSSNALLLARVVEFNFDAVPERYKRIAQTMGLKVAGKRDEQVREELVQHLIDFHEQVGITQTLGQLGVTKEDIPGLARKAKNDPCLLTNPKDLSVEDIEVIYVNSL